MPLEFGWATEAQVWLEKLKNKKHLCITIWPGDTKTQGWQVFIKDLGWISQQQIATSFGKFELVINPYIKFSHVMGRWIGAIYFTDNLNEMGKMFHNKRNFERLCHRWDRSQWGKLEEYLDNDFNEKFDWRQKVVWELSFIRSGRNFVFISMGFECNIYIPFSTFKEVERTGFVRRTSGSSD